MSGQGEGKYELKGAKVYLHEQGKSNARITHIDIEHPDINKIIKNSRHPTLKCGVWESASFCDAEKENSSTI